MFIDRVLDAAGFRRRKVIPAFCSILGLFERVEMIDWVTAALPCSHLPLPTGKVMKVEFTGEITWATPCRTSIAGSFESHIMVRSGGGDGR